LLLKIVMKKSFLYLSDLIVKLNQVQFNSMVFQDQNGICGMKPEHSDRNLAEKSGIDRDLK